MLREFQEEIQRLKAELASSAASLQTLPQPQEQRVERVVERALSPEEVMAMRVQMEQEMQQEVVQQGEPLDADTLVKVSNLNLWVICHVDACIFQECVLKRALRSSMRTGISQNKGYNQRPCL